MKSIYAFYIYWASMSRSEISRGLLIRVVDLCPDDRDSIPKCRMFFFLNCVSIYDFIFKMMNFTGFRSILLNITIIAYFTSCLLKPLKRVKMNLKNCKEMIEKNSYTDSLFQGAFKQKILVARKEIACSLFISLDQKN